MNKLILLAILLLIPTLSFANGGDQRVVENKYFINLSRAPFTPRVGVQTSFLASFVDIQKNKLIAEDLIVKVRIAKQGGAGGKREFIFEQDNLIIKGGILELKYTFDNSGLHEIFFDFAFIPNPQKIYEVPDFMIDVQKQETSPKNQFILLTMTGLAGLIVGFIIGRNKNIK